MKRKLQSTVSVKESGGKDDCRKNITDWNFSSSKTGILNGLDRNMGVLRSRDHHWGSLSSCSHREPIRSSINAPCDKIIFKFSMQLSKLELTAFRGLRGLLDFKINKNDFHHWTVGEWMWLLAGPLRPPLDVQPRPIKPQSHGALHPTRSSHASNGLRRPKP